MVRISGGLHQQLGGFILMPVILGMVGYVVEHGNHLAHGRWASHEMSQSSTWRELAMVARIFESVAHHLANHRVRWFTDNQNIVRIISVGSRVPALQAIALKFQLVFK